MTSLSSALVEGLRMDPVRVPSARRRRILDVLDWKGAASISQLAAELGVSIATVHRDLRVLESESALLRVQGGATSLASGQTEPGLVESSWAKRLQLQPRAKLAIGLAALDYVESGDTVFLDGSTTALAMAAALEIRNPPITLVTTSPAIAHTMVAPAIRLICAPGQVDQWIRIMSGSWTNQFLADLNFSTAFISGAGVSSEGTIFTESHEIQVTVRLALSRAARKVCLLDSSKIGRVASLTLAEAAEFDVLILDSRHDDVQWSAAAPDSEVVLTGSGSPDQLNDSAIWQTYFA